MRINMLDYVANLGGGARFARELAVALLDIPDTSVNIVSTGAALGRYKELFTGLPVSFLDCPPDSEWRNRPVHVVPKGMPRAMHRLLRKAGVFRAQYRVPRAAWESCDVLWLPWIHHHAPPPRLGGPTVCSLHDTIVFEFKQLSTPWWRREERRCSIRWLKTPACIATSSIATQGSMAKYFRRHMRPVDLVRVAPQPRNATPREPAGFASQIRGRKYLLCPTNLTPHKNVEGLLSAAHYLPKDMCLVLTGGDTDHIARGAHGRGAELANFGASWGMYPDENLILPGYVTDEEYFWILDHAFALITPTLAEGGGSFPVAEAMGRGVPVLTSDIPVLREFLEHLGGEVIWFDPLNRRSIVAAIGDLIANYDRYLGRARAQASHLSHRSWNDVAREYHELFKSVARAR